MSGPLLAAAERGLLPTALVRVGIRRLLRKRLAQLGGPEQEQAFLAQMRTAPIALATADSRRQHYEVPPAFFERVLGPHLKYSSCWFDSGAEDLATAERRMLDLTMERAQLADGQRILELGCGWGSLTLAMAARFPAARITAVSHSRPQREFIEARARERGLANVEVRTCDMNDFDAGARHDRVVSVEMFEHMRNWEALLSRVHGWLEPTGRLFLHVFAHRARTYPFEDRGRDDWMARHFFTGGLMPAADLLGRLSIPFRVEEAWTVDGRHYAQTAARWRENLDRERAEVERILAGAGAGGEAHLAAGRWRLFFLACEELFGFDKGREWPVVHARLVPTSAGRAA
ncbi:MAG: SAM-dependent methyltransferase [Planctomycetia bacterium]